MRRILIVGCCGAGKTTLANELSKRLNLPVVHLDRLWWNPGWIESTPEKFDARLAAELLRECWIIDGNYKRTLAERLRYADTVLLLAYSRTRCLWQIFRRFREFHGRTRPDLADGCPERIDGEFLRFVWNFNRRVLPEVRQILAQRPAGCTLREFRTPAETERFLSSLPPAR